MLLKQYPGRRPGRLTLRKMRFHSKDTLANCQGFDRAQQQFEQFCVCFILVLQVFRLFSEPDYYH